MAVLVDRGPDGLDLGATGDAFHHARGEPGGGVHIEASTAEREREGAARHSGARFGATLGAGPVARVPAGRVLVDISNEDEVSARTTRAAPVAESGGALANHDELGA